MTACETFFKAAATGSLLPASVPFETEDEDGLLSVVFNVCENPEAKEATFSPDPDVRATAAVYACKAAVYAVDKQFQPAD